MGSTVPSQPLSYPSTLPHTKTQLCDPEARGPNPSYGQTWKSVIAAQPLARRADPDRAALALALVPLGLSTGQPHTSSTATAKG